MKFPIYSLYSHAWTFTAAVILWTFIAEAILWKFNTAANSLDLHCSSNSLDIHSSSNSKWNRTMTRVIHFIFFLFFSSFFFVMLKCILAFFPSKLQLFNNNNNVKQILAEPLKITVNRLITCKTDWFPTKSCVNLMNWYTPIRNTLQFLSI